MRRRNFLAGSLAGATALAAPNLVRADSEQVLKFVPQSDLAGLDPVFSSADVIRTYAGAVFDTLYGEDDAFAPQPQMVAGHTTDADGLLWELTLRDGLVFHDGSPVLARDCIASVRRFMQRDSLGAVTAARMAEMAAASDKVIRIRLTRPFPLLPSALAQYSCVVMPERLAANDSDKQVTESIGSGPFRYKADERVPGARVVFEKFDKYVPRDNGAPSACAGPKVAYFDRVEWTVMPDTATASGALLNKEVDWWENPPLDIVPLLRRDKDIVIRVLDTTGVLASMRFNFLNPPFDNPAIRRAVLSAMSQRDAMQAVGGAEPSLTRTGVGIFVPDTPMASEAGLSAMRDPPDLEQARRDLIAAGYKGERVVVLAGTNLPAVWAEAQVGTETLKKLGMNVDFQALDWATVVQRRMSKAPLDQGGWSVIFVAPTGTGNVNPATSNLFRGDGRNYGWPTDAKIEALRNDWFNAPDIAGEKRIAAQIQQRFFEFAPYVPLGLYYAPTAYRSYLRDMRGGWPYFYGVRRT
jgi:peptide/nickel transport system substrate-binding protein